MKAGACANEVCSLIVVVAVVVVEVMIVVVAAEIAEAAMPCMNLACSYFVVAVAFEIGLEIYY